MDPNVSKNRHYLRGEIGVSIVMLLDSITKAGFTITGIPLNYDWFPTELLIERMKDQGWCPSAIETLRRGQQVHNLYSANTLGPPPLAGDHTKCTKLFCKRNQIDESKYETKHQPGCTDCAFLPDEEVRFKIHDSLSEQCIPLIMYTWTKSDWKVEIRDTIKMPAYVAISHVCTLYFLVH